MTRWLAVLAAVVLAASAQAATVTRYINTASTPGGDGTTNATAGAARAYASMSEWEAAEQTNLVTDSDSHIVHCEGTAADTTACSISAWTTGAANDITIQVDAGATRHSGEWSASHYRLYVANADAFTISEDHVNVYGLQIGLSASDGHRDDPIILTSITAGGGIEFVTCIVRGADNDTYSTILFVQNDNDTVLLLRNCLFYDAGSNGSSYGLHGSGTGTITIENCTVGNCYRGIGLSGTVTETNVLVTGSDGEDWFNYASHTRTYCAGDDDDTSADEQGGAGNRVSQTFTFSSGYLLASNDAGARTYGTDLSGTFTDDIQGDTRSAWDIGADEYVAAGGNAMPMAQDLFGRRRR